MIKAGRFIHGGLVAGLIMAALFCIVAAFRTAADPDPYPLKYPSNFGNMIYVPDDNPTTRQGVELGRRLFYETALSANNRISCSSCHRQENAFADNKPFSTGVDNIPTRRNSMALVNLLWVNNFFWDGRARGLEQQAAFPLTDPHEMGQSLEASVSKLEQTNNYSLLFKAAFGDPEISAKRILMALSQFERTLISASSRYDDYLAGRYQPTAEERRGMELFFSMPDLERQIRGAACGHCHGGPKTFNELYHNTGLDSIPADGGREEVTGRAGDRGRFRVATLRNIALTAPYMHDGRFASLEAVLDHYSDHISKSPLLSPFLRGLSNNPVKEGLALTPTEKREIISFLHLLTDSTFITDKRFSNPFTPNSNPSLNK